MTLAAKLLIGCKKKLGWCNDGTEILYHHGGNRTTHVGVRGFSVVFFLVFFPLTFQFGSCNRLNWLPVGF